MNKDKILSMARQKHQITYKIYPIRLTSDFYTETMQASKEWKDILKTLKGKTISTKNTVSGKTFLYTRMTNKSIFR